MIGHFSTFCLLFNLIVAQFPDHFDLEKLGEVTYGKEKYKILRPSLHRIRDHFKDVMMRRDTGLPQTKLLMDDNGFRHYWSTINDIESRKSDNNEINIKSPKKKRQQKITRDDFYQELKEQRAEHEKEILRQNSGTAAKETTRKPLPNAGTGKQMYLYEVTMFCPYLGVLTTKHYLDKEPAAPANPK